MSNNLYWVSAATYVVVLAIILINDYHAERKANELEKAFRLMGIWVLFFCFQDILWGLCDSDVITSDKVFFVSSTIFHVSTVLTTFFWLNFVLIFIKGNEHKRKLYLGIDGVVILFEVSLAIINIFTPTLFYIENGVYYAAYLRPLTFVNQYSIYLYIGMKALVYAIKDKQGKRSDFLSVFAFSFAPIIMGVLQLLFINMPFYSLGYFLGFFIVHIFIVARERTEFTRSSVLNSIADTYFSMHLIDLEANYYEALIQPKVLSDFVGEEKNPQRFVNKVASRSAAEEYQKDVLAFLNLSDLPERMANKKMIVIEFFGIQYGWTRLEFVEIERNDDELAKVMLTTRIIDAEKRKQMELVYKSNNDELTGLFNRRAFDQDIQELENDALSKNMIIVSMDLNGLKNVNDTIGHIAGDEMIKGAADCMKKCFSTYGKVYRTGGDEFNAIIFATKEELEEIKKEFEDTLFSWKGKNVQNLSVACGYIEKRDLQTDSIREMCDLADKKMYEEKAHYYQENGVDRIGQKNAYTAICASYTKILKINITDDTYQIINMDKNEYLPEFNNAPKISEWLIKFAKTGHVHVDDCDEFLQKSDLGYMRLFFSENHGHLSILYRRKIGEEFKRCIMEIIPADDYKPDNQKLFLYVKEIGYSN